MICKITKDDLDQQRIKETNAYDMMQNQTIIYHMESLLEMQIFCTLTCLAIESVCLKQRDHLKIHDNGASSHHSLVMTLLVEHIVSYFLNIVRMKDLSKNGKPDANGVYRAPKES